MEDILGKVINISSKVIDINLFSQGKYDEIKNFVEKGYSLPIDAFMKCVEFGHTELAKYVLVVDNKEFLGNRACIACKYGNLKLLEYIISFGVKPFLGLLITAALNNQANIGEYLLSIKCEYTKKVTNTAITQNNIENVN